MNSVLIIGSGNRVQNNFLPAFSCLSDRYKISGLHSRTERHCAETAGKWNIRPVRLLSEAPFNEIDTVVLSVTLAGNRSVLKVLEPHARNLILIIDTPVLAVRQFTAISILKKFKKVYVAEDFIEFPAFRIMRELIKEGGLGSVQKVLLKHAGYKYHGTALIRSFFDYRKVLYSRCSGSEADGKSLVFRMRGGGEGIITEPYHRLDGKINVLCENGAVNLSGNSSDAEHSVFYRLSEVWNQDGFRGIQIDNGQKSELRKVEYYDQIRRIQDIDNSHFNILKTCGLIRILKSAYSGQSGEGYSWTDGLYDQYLSRFSWQFPVYPDLFSAFVR